MSLWREMLIGDIPCVYNIAMDIWTTHKESRTIYENKFFSFPEGCYVYDDNGIKGYIISHPYNISSPPKINTLLTKVEINCLFIHDIVIVSEYRGRGIGNEIINKILNNNKIVSLVACDDKAKDFWAGYGFEVVKTSDWAIPERSRRESVGIERFSVETDVGAAHPFVGECDYGIYMVKNIDKLNIR